MPSEDASRYDSPLDPSNLNDPRSLALQLVGRDKDVLELGPATGCTTSLLSRQNCRVVAIEIDPAMEPHLRPYCSEIIFGDIERLSLSEKLRDRNFDVILAGDFLEHLVNPTKLLRELQFYLKDSGYVVASIPNVAHGSIRLSLLKGKFKYKDLGILDRTHLRFFTLETIFETFAEAGLVVVDVRRVRLDPFIEPYVSTESGNIPGVTQELQKLIESDPESATVQFVVKAYPRNSEEGRLYLQVKSQMELQAQLQRISTLETQLENQKLNFENELERQKLNLRNREQLIATIETQMRETQKQAAENQEEIAKLRAMLADVQRSASEARAQNEALTFYLNRYKRIKDKFLPPGSWRVRLARKVLLPLLTPVRQRKGSSATIAIPSQKTVPSTAGTVLNNISVVTPPKEWCDSPQRPPVVIAIPNWNRVDLLRRCIESILTNTTYDRYRICVYEQGSTDGSREYLHSLGDQVDVILAPDNIGFVGANNAIIGRYRDWDIVFLNNDTEVSHGWLTSLMETAYAAEAIGLVGAKLVYGDGRLQEAGSQVFCDGSARAYGRFEDAWNPEFNQLREVDYCSAACLYAKRKVLNLTGGFDERYSPAYYEDTDLAFAARAAGFKVIYEPHSVVVHHEYSTSGTTAVELMERNRTKFVEKWSRVLARHQKNFWEAVSVDGREKVLVIDDIVPAPDRSSGGTRLYEFLNCLSEHYHVVLAYVAAFGVREYVKPLERFGITVFYPGYAKAVHNHDLDLGAILLHNDFKYVFFELYSTAEKYMDIVEQYSPMSKKVVDTFDVHFLREMREAQITANTQLTAKANETKLRELEVYRRADLVLTVTEDDRKALLQEDSRLNVAVVPNIHSIPTSVSPRARRRDLMFVGGFSHTPNVDAVLYFCSEIFPFIKRRVPEIKFYIVGNAPPPQVIALASKDIIVTGYVPSVVPYLESMLISVAPLRFGAGMKGKIGEAMAYGLPVVTTTVGAEGMALKNEEEVLIADTPEQFAECVIRLYEDTKLWNAIAVQARSRVERDWSPAAVGSRLGQLLQRNLTAVLRA